MHSLIHEQYVRAQHAERVARRGWSGRRLWRRPPPPQPPPRPPGRGGGLFGWQWAVRSGQGLAPAELLSRQPRRTRCVQPLHLWACQAGHVALHVEADRSLRVGQVAIYGRELPEQVSVELELRRRVERVEPVL